MNPWLRYNLNAKGYNWFGNGYIWSGKGYNSFRNAIYSGGSVTEMNFNSLVLIS